MRVACVAICVLYMCRMTARRFVLCRMTAHCVLARYMQRYIIHNNATRNHAQRVETIGTTHENQNETRRDERRDDVERRD